MSVSPGMSPPALRRINCNARPMVALARKPCPKTLPRALSFSAFTIGPLMISSGELVLVAVCIP